jgi:hypothetical protein
VTFTTEFIPLPSEFLQYLCEDGIYFSEDAKIFGDIANCDDTDEEDRLALSFVILI